MSIDTSFLLNVHIQPDRSIICGCPACIDNGSDNARNHLRIYPSMAFNCVKHPGDREHNRSIRAFLLKNNKDGSSENYEYVEPAPKLSVDTVYPESSLSKLLKEYGYWRNRGLNERVLARFEGGIAPENQKSKLGERYIFPIRNSYNQIVGFSARLIKDNSFAPKWKILGRKNQFIFPNPAISQLSSSESVVLVEGIGDCLALAQMDVHNTLCLFGLNISGEQIGYLISQGVKTIYISTNNEASGIGNKAAEKLKTRLSHFFNAEDIHIKLPIRKDFLDSLPDHPEEIETWKESLIHISL